MRGLLIFLSSILIFNSCKTTQANAVKTSEEQLADEGFIKYSIAAGKQKPIPNPFAFFDRASLKFIVHFDSSAIYSNSGKKDKRDINKLYGFSDNFSLHHRYSARFGWRWLNDSLQLTAYCYNNGLRSFKEICNIPLNGFDTCEIKVAGNEYIFSVNGKSMSMPRSAKGENAVGYKLFPYFGGNESAPQDIHIYIKELK